MAAISEYLQQSEERLGSVCPSSRVVFHRALTPARSIFQHQQNPQPGQEPVLKSSHPRFSLLGAEFAVGAAPPGWARVLSGSCHPFHPGFQEEKPPWG